MTTISREDLERGMRPFEGQQFDDAADAFAEDGVFIDPHYPDAEFRGREEIQGAFEWVFEHALDDIELTIRHFWAAGMTCAAEVDTRQTMKDGSVHELSQVFIAEFDDRKHLTRLQAYLPYGPPEQAGN